MYKNPLCKMWVYFVVCDVHNLPKEKKIYLLFHSISKFGKSKAKNLDQILDVTAKHSIIL